MFESLRLKPADPLLEIIAAHRSDSRPDRIDLGVGVFRDATGATPIMRAVKAAEAHLVSTQPTKAYIGTSGDGEFLDLLRPIIFGVGAPDHRVVPALQTPGGSGALRLGAELIAAARPSSTVWIGAPSWPNHRAIFEACRLQIGEYTYAELGSQSLLFEAMIAALGAANPGDVVLLHGCCHNPTGIDLTKDQWRVVAAICSERSLLPFIDLAYQGLATDLDADASGLRNLLTHVPEALVAYSCDKNFGLYRERVGALFAITRNREEAHRAASNLAVHARVNWSMPPDHGAAIVRTILEDPVLTDDWQAELRTVRAHIRLIRLLVADAAPELAAIARQNGLFSNLALSSAQVGTLRSNHGIYLAPSGRMNLLGLRPENIHRLVGALREVGGLPELQ